MRSSHGILRVTVMAIALGTIVVAGLFLVRSSPLTLQRNLWLVGPVARGRVVGERDPDSGLLLTVRMGCIPVRVLRIQDTGPGVRIHRIVPGIEVWRLSL